MKVSFVDRCPSLRGSKEDNQWKKMKMIPSEFIPLNWAKDLISKWLEPTSYQEKKMKLSKSTKKILVEMPITHPVTYLVLLTKDQTSLPRCHGRTAAEGNRAAGEEITRDRTHQSFMSHLKSINSGVSLARPTVNGILIRHFSARCVVCWRTARDGHPVASGMVISNFSARCVAAPPPTLTTALRWWWHDVWTTWTKKSV